MPRRARQISCGLSLLIFALSVCLWLRSWFAIDQLSRSSMRTESTSQNPNTQTSIVSLYASRGVIGLRHYRFTQPGAAGVGVSWKWDRFKPPGLTGNVAGAASGFEFEHY